MTDDDKFDHEWDIKQENGLNVTENKLLEAMKKIGLNPETQYKISRMTVDFAFPEEKIAIEVNGPYHYTEEQKMADKKRYFALKKFGWKRKIFSSKYAYHYPDKVAKEIAELVGKTEILDNHKDIDSQSSSHINEQNNTASKLPDYPTDYTQNKLKPYGLVSRIVKHKKTTISAVILLILVFVMLNRFGDFDRSAININASTELNTNPSIDVFCNEKCNTSTFGNFFAERISVIRCICKDERGYPDVVYYFDSRSKEKITQDEVFRRQEQYQKSVTILP